MLSMKAWQGGGSILRGLGRSLALLWLAAFGLAAGGRAAAPYVWIEGESPTSANVPVETPGSSHGQYLSGGQLLQLTADAGEVEKKVPADGALFKYAFTAPEAADYQVWDRIGYEFARCPFDWRIDGGDWKTVQPDELTTDLMELDFFREIAWLKLGTHHLAAGPHALEVRVTRFKNAKGEPQRLLYACDALCLTSGDFRPNSKFKPDESGRDEADRDADRVVFDLPEAKGRAERTSVPLKGTWEICRDDEERPGEVAEPIKELRRHPVWKAIAVPGDKGEKRHEMLFAHRVWYRVRVDVPASLEGRSFSIDFPQNNLNTTVFVNGTFCGFSKNPFARFTADVTRAVKPGQVNEVLVGIRDAWYGYSNDPKDPLRLRRHWNLPTRFLGTGWQDMVYPEWNRPQSGILETPVFVAAGGPAYAADVFPKPSVAHKRLAVEVTVNNPSGREARGDVVCEAVDPKTGKVEKTLPAGEFAVAAGQSQVVEVSGAWADPKLWWPDEDAHLYTLRTTVRVDGRPADVSETTFGFREWTLDGKDFRLNGVVWHGWADVFTAPDKDAWLAFYREHNERFYRFWAPNRFYDLSDEEAFNFFDRHGIVVRRTGVLDGEGMGYLGEHVEELGRNWIDQVCAQVRGERNHPSVMVWSLENEISYINAINAGWIDRWEKVTAEAWDRIHNGQDGRSVDPTRPVMVDGGGAGKALALPVHGDHYITGDLTRYPTLAYEANPSGGGRGRWVWDQKRPRFIGEDWYIAGNHPEFSTVGGEAAFGGKAAALPAAGLLIGMAQQGYRWADYGAWHFWMGQADADGSQYRFFAPRAALCREWDWTFESGRAVRRTIGLFNDTHDAGRIGFTWVLNFDGKKFAGQSWEYEMEPGTRQVVGITLPLPSVRTRAEGELVLTLEAGGREVYRDTKAVSVLNTEAGAVPERLAHLGTADLLVADPSGAVARFLEARELRFTPVTDLGRLPDSGKVLIVGKDALSPAESTSTALAAWAAAGRTVIVLEQDNPLRYQALPAELDTTTAAGRVAFGEDMTHPALRGLQQKDFFTWGDDEVLFRNAYGKPARGAKSLIQCGDSLQNSALVEVPAGKGLLLLCQLTVGENLRTNAVAQRLLLNLADNGAGYKQTFRPVTAVVEGAPQLAKALDAVGLQATRTADPLEAIRKPGGIAVIAATPENLRKLAENRAAVDAFTSGGGWVVFNGLTPDGLESYNKLVGWEHMIRPFGGTPSLTNRGPRGVERVTFPPVRDPLLAGVTTTDISMYSSTQIFPWAAGNFTASDEFTYVIDYDEVAPFGKSPFAHYGNITNGFVSADGWPLIINVPIPKDGKPFAVPIELPGPQTITEFTWVGNTLYWPQTRVNLVFDGDREHPASYEVKPNAEPQTLPVQPPRTARRLTLEVAGWQEVPGKGALIGIDNIYLKAQRPPEFYEKVKPMLNVGGMMHYPRGEGGIVLCNLLLQDHEEVPENAGKKQKILATLLRNLTAPFTGARTVIVGTNLTYTPIDLSKQATQYRDEKGWFGDRQFTFRDLPTGKQKLAGVTFDIYDFPTSPVPTVVMLAGGGVPGKLPREVVGIPVGRKADALFFLQTARIDRRMDDQERKDKKRFELFRYVVHYADGTAETVPVSSETDIDNYRQEKPLALPGAALAWTRPYAGTPFSAVAYSMQWNNPHPDREIATIDMAYGKDSSRGVPALLAVTAASVAGK
jgi:hypothetical protein